MPPGSPGDTRDQMLHNISGGNKKFSGVGVNYQQPLKDAKVLDHLRNMARQKKNK